MFDSSVSAIRRQWFRDGYRVGWRDGAAGNGSAVYATVRERWDHRAEYRSWAAGYRRGWHAGADVRRWHDPERIAARRAVRAR